MEARRPYRTVRHYEMSYQKLRDLLGIKKTENLMEVVDYTDKIRVSTEEIAEDRIKGDKDGQ